MTPSHEEPRREEVDPWEAAREHQRSQVQAIFATRESAPAVERRRDFRPSRRAWIVIAIGLAAVAALTAVVVPNLRDSAAEERRADRVRQLALEARERTRLRAEVQPRRAPGPRRRAAEAPLAYRARLVSAGESSIAADARARVRAGTLKGPVAGTQCTPFPIGPARSALEADPGARRGRYECVAYARSFAIPLQGDGQRTGILGAPYWLVADYTDGGLTFCRVTPRPAEGGKALVSVVVPAPCRDPQRPR